MLDYFLDQSSDFLEPCHDQEIAKQLVEIQFGSLTKSFPSFQFFYAKLS